MIRKIVKSEIIIVVNLCYLPIYSVKQYENVEKRKIKKIEKEIENQLIKKP